MSGYYGRYDSGSSGSGWRVLGVIILIASIIIGMVSCSRTFSEQGITRSYGGSMEVWLEPNRKLVEITWKDASLWYLTKPMTDEDVAEEYLFQEKDVTGWLEGSVIVHERKMDEEEYQQYLETKYLEYDYYRDGNFAYDEETGESREVYITCDPETGEYKKIKDYEVSETGALIGKQ